MTIFHSRAPFVAPPDDLSIPQFILDEVNHATRPHRADHIPCFIEEESGKALFLSELRERSHRLAKTLKGRWGIGPNDVVSLYAPNHVDYGVIIWAVHRLGGIISAHSGALTTEELEYQLRIAEPVLLVAHPENLTVALDAMKKVGLAQERLVLLDGNLAPEAPFPSVDTLIESHSQYPQYTEHKLKAGEAKNAIAFFCYSSGTTGPPKAVAVSHYNVIASVVQVSTFNRIHEEYLPWEYRRFRPGDVCAGVLPLYHVYGLVVSIHLVIYGAVSVVIGRRFNYETLLKSIERYRITHLMIVPPQAVLFCKHPLTKKFDLSSIRYCIVAAAPLSAELTLQLQQLFPGVQIGQGYGLTETCSGVSQFPIDQLVGTLGSSGQLIPGTTAKVVKPDGTLAGVGEPGELYLKGPQVMLGYYRNEEANKEVFADGWLRTGDEVVFQANGDLFVTDRIKELIKVKGHQVSPSELEGHLLNHPDVADAAVIGVPDDYAGEVPLAFVVLKPPLATKVNEDAELAGDVRDRIDKHVSAVTSRYKWLEGGIEFVDAIPKSASGKILRGILTQRGRQVQRKARL